MNESIKLFSGRSNPLLAKEIANYLNLNLNKIKLETFPDGELFAQYMENIRGSDVFLIQSISIKPNDMLMELLIMVDAAKRASADRITVVLPYYGYARQDRKDKPRVPITAKLIANLLTTAGVDRVLTVDLHAQQIQGYFDIPVDHLSCSSIFIPYFKKHLKENIVIVAPDSGSVKVAQSYADSLDCDIAIIAKHRIDASTIEANHLVGNVKNKQCVIIDDLSSTAGTLIGAAKLLKTNGATNIYAAISHCLLNKISEQKVAKSEITELLITDSIAFEKEINESKIKCLTIAPLIGEAIHRIHNNKSITFLNEE